MKNSFLEKTQKGFSLIEITVAMGMLGVLTTVILNLGEQQVGLEKRSELNAELASFHSRLLEVFNSRQSCVNTLGGVGAIVAPGGSITNIMNDSPPPGPPAPAALYSVGNQFGRVLNPTTRTFTIQSITLQFGTTAADLAGDPATPNFRTAANLNVIYLISPNVAGYQGNREKPRTIPLGDIQITEVTAGTSYTLRGCVGNVVIVPVVRPRDACDSITGVYDPIGARLDTCRLANFFDYDTAGTQSICGGTPGITTTSPVPANCITAWSVTTAPTAGERQAVSSEALFDYTQRIYGIGSSVDGGRGTTNLFLGRRAGVDNTATGINNTFVGDWAGEDNTTGVNNLFVGQQAGKDNTTGTDNTFVGTLAGEFTTTGSKNVFVGKDAGKDNTTGANNTFVGILAGKSTSTGSRNVFVGKHAGRAETTGADNTFVGVDAGIQASNGKSNVFVGKGAGWDLTTGSDNIMIGTNATRDSNAGITIAGSDQLRIGNLLFGKIPANTTGSPNISIFGTSGLAVNGGLAVKNAVTVGSYIKIGTTAISCTTSAAGALRYNTTSKKLEFCNESAWVELGGGGGGGAQHPVLLRTAP